MDAKELERIDSTRYKAMIWQTVGLGIFYPNVTLIRYAENKIIYAIMMALAIAGAITFVISMLRIHKIKKAIKADPKLGEALNNELYRQYAYHAGWIAFFVMFHLLILLMLITILYDVDISAYLICVSVTYLGLMTLLISCIVMERDVKLPSIKEKKVYPGTG